jgi:MarR family transcriptional regulator, organic hydroperoxide resistance regulator
VKTESVLLMLQRATHATLHLLTHELRDLELTGSEINALGNLAGHPGRTVSDLGAAIGSRPATVTGILDRLEQRGLIRRAPHPADRRAVLVELTADGAKVAARIGQTVRAVERRALAGISPDLVDAAHTVLRALTEAAR